MCLQSWVYPTFMTPRLCRSVDCAIASSFNDSLSGQKLRYHKVADILIRPVRQMAGDACPNGYIEEASGSESISNCQNK